MLIGRQLMPMREPDPKSMSTSQDRYGLYGKLTIAAGLRRIAAYGAGTAPGVSSKDANDGDRGADRIDCETEKEQLSTRQTM